MAMNVFGNPINDATLHGMPEYENKTITRLDRATVALNMKNAGGHDSKVLEYVDNIGKNCGFEVKTLCVMYNATGDTMRFVSRHDWYGHIDEHPYPITIANGQWGGFVHVKSGGTDSGSHAGVVYRGKDKEGVERDWMFSWRNAQNRDYDNLVYSEVRMKDHFNDDIWGVVYNSREKFARIVMTDTWEGCTSSSATGSGHRAVVEAIFTLEDA